MTAVLEPVPAPTGPQADMWSLVVAAQAGDREAFAGLYARYMDTVFRFVYFRVGNRQLAEDLTADTFERALKRIGSFTWQGRDIAAWLVTIARNLVADYFKGGRYRLEVLGGSVSGMAGDPLLQVEREAGPELPMEPEDAVVAHLEAMMVGRALQELNEEQHEVLVLRFYRGLPVAEVGRIMGKNEGAIKALQYRAVRALARALPEGWER